MQDGDKTAPASLKKQPAEAEKPQWQFHPTAEPPTSNSVPPSVSWTASEFIAHDKAPSWYGVLTITGVLLAGLVYLMSQDWISTGVIIIITVIFGVFASRKPRTLTYSLDQSGVHIGDKFYAYTEFKSFSILDDDGIDAVWLMPLKRFMPSFTIYFPPQEGDKIMSVLGNYLPLERHERDMIDKFMRKVRF